MRSRTALVCALLKRKCDPAQILFMLALRRALLGCDSTLDIGCGTSRKLREIGAPNTVGLEAYPPARDAARRSHTHDRFVAGDARNLTDHFQPRQFDACVALDVIEHLSKEDGLQLMQAMETIARKRVILFTPNGFLPQAHRVDGDLQAHLSGWDATEMRGRGYRVIGQLGPKTMRGEHHAIKRPVPVWSVLSLLSQLSGIRSEPSAAILCIKEPV